MEEHLLVGSDDSTLRPVAVGLVLRRDDSHQVRVILHQHHLRVVHGQIDRIKAALHLTIEFHRLIRSLQISQQYRVADQILFPEVIETPEERIRRRERRDINIRTPGLFQDPVQQTERVETFTQETLQRALG